MGEDYSVARQTRADTQPGWYRNGQPHYGVSVYHAQLPYRPQLNVRWTS